MSETPEFDPIEAQEYAAGSSKKERLLLSYLISNEEAWAMCSRILEPAYFEKENQNAVGFLIEHTEKYRKLPTPEMIDAESGVPLDIYPDAKDPRRLQWVADEVEKFCRTRAVVNAVYEAFGKIEKNEIDDLVDPIKKAVNLSLHRDLGTDYFHDPLTRLKRMLENTALPTGFKDLDHLLFGGVSRGTVSFTLAGSGVGKSVLLTNFGLNHVEQGLNVVYVTLELSEDLVAKRSDSMVTGISSREIFKRMEEVADRVRLRKRKCGALQLKYMPSGSNCRDIASYLREYTIQTGIKPDVLIVDYIDLMSPNAKVKDLGNLWVKDKYVTEELRSLAGEYNVICYTAAQLNRGAMEEETHRQDHIAGGISKIQTADNVWSIYQSLDMKEAGLYQIQLIKTRSSSGVGKRLLLVIDPDTMRVSDAPPDAQVGRVRAPNEIRNANDAGSQPASKVGFNSDRLAKIKQRINRT